MPEKQNDISAKVILAILVLTAAIFNYTYLIKQSLRLDEAQSIWQVTYSAPKILSVVATDVHVPFYHILLHYWMLIVGQNIDYLRLLSVFFYLLCIPAIYFLAKEAFGDKKMALFSSLLLTISAYMNWYASELRMYSLFTLLTILNQTFFIQTWKAFRWKTFIPFLITALLGIYTHYFFFLLLITEVVFLFLHKFNARLWIPKIVGTGLLIAASFAPWIYLVIQQLSKNYARPLITRPKAIDLFNIFSQYLFGYQSDYVNTLIIAFWPLAALVIFFWTQKTKGIKDEFKFFLYVSFLPIILAFLISLFLRPVLLSRYLIFVIPSMYIIVSRLLYNPNMQKQNLLRYARFGVLAIMLFGLIHQTFSINTPAKENFREATVYISERATNQDVVALSAPFIVYPVEYYYRGKAKVTTIPYWDRLANSAIPNLDDQELKTEVTQMESKYKKVWLLMSYDQGYQAKVEDYFKYNYKLLEQKEFSPKLILYVYELNE